MSRKEKIGVAIVLAVIILVVAWYFYFRNSADKTWETFWRDVLYGVISSENGGGTSCTNLSGSGCSGKRYTDVLLLDSGTVGIAHFAAGGLCRLYKKIDTYEYFGRSEDDMCDNYADRDSGASNNDWWINGFQRWTSESKNNSVQDQTFAESRQSAVDSAIENGWTTNRQMAIAVGVSNSFGNSGFRTRASNADWNAEELLNWYGSLSEHKNRRKLQINKHFPKSKQINLA